MRRRIRRIVRGFGKSVIWTSVAALIFLYGWRLGCAAVPAKTVAEERETVQSAEAVQIVEQVPLETMFPRDPELDAEASAMARMLYGQCRWNSRDAQEAVAWLVCNRVDSSLYPNSIIEVCEQPSQWMGQGEENVLQDDLYELALEVITRWRAGGMRPVGADYLFLTWSMDAVTLRTSFNETSNTRYMRVE